MSSTRDPILIARRFRGPLESGNGGYSAGVIGAQLGTEAEVTLRAPPPLDTPLSLERKSDGSLVMHHGERLIAEGRIATLEIEVPDPIDWDRALAAEDDYPW